MMTQLPSIVKVQRPLSGHVGRTAFLVYDEGRTREVVQGIPKRALEALGNDPKGYFRAVKMDLGKAWWIGERVEDQPW